MNSYETQYYLFDIVNNVMLGLLLISYIGVSSLAPNYLEMLRMVVQIYISLFLIVRFNPYTKRASFSGLDRKVAYSAGIFIFTSTIIAKYVTSKISKNTGLKDKETDLLKQYIG